MNSTQAATETSQGFKPSFFFWMTVLMAFFVFGGFGMTYWYPMAAGTFPSAPPVVHLHGLVYSLWMILLVAQASLVHVKNMTLHRSLGTFGIALATAVFFMGSIITLLAVMSFKDRPPNSQYHGIYLGIMAVVGFAILFCLAIRNVRKPDIHKRLILLAMLPILPPGIHRLYMVPMGLDSFPLVAMYLTLDAMAIAIIVEEWRSSGKIGKYTLIGVGWIVMQQLLHYPANNSQMGADFMYWLSGLVYYR